MEKQNLFIKETWINRTENYCCGESGFFESRFTTVKEVFECYRKQGKIQRMYKEDSEGNSVQCGYLINYTAKYEDTKEPYKAETWIEVSSTEPKKVYRTENLTNPFLKTK